MPSPRISCAPTKIASRGYSEESEDVKAYSEMLKAEFNRREELEDDDARQLAEIIKSKL